MLIAVIGLPEGTESRILPVENDETSSPEDPRIGVGVAAGREIPVRLTYWLMPWYFRVGVVTLTLSYRPINQGLCTYLLNRARGHPMGQNGKPTWVYPSGGIECPCGSGECPRGCPWLPAVRTWECLSSHPPCRFVSLHHSASFPIVPALSSWDPIFPFTKHLNHLHHQNLHRQILQNCWSHSKKRMSPYRSLRMSHCRNPRKTQRRRNLQRIQNCYTPHPLH